MFTLAQIENAHSKVESGKGFPQYIRELIALGVLRYSFFVIDGHTEYTGADTNIVSPATYPPLTIATDVDIDKFKHYLKIHQQGETDYLTFCRHSAESGVYSWTVDTINKTCTYYDTSSAVIVVESIPV